MRTIVLANGDSGDSPKLAGRHFLEVDGEVLLDRAIRQFGANGDVIVSGPDDRYRRPGAALYVPLAEDLGDADIVLATRRIWGLDERTLLVLGDTWFTDEAVRQIVERGRVDRPWFYAGREGGSRFSGTDYGELFALSFWPEDRRALLDAAFDLVQRQRDGLWRAGLWEHYRLLVDVDPLEHRIAGHFLEIDDETEDVDFEGPLVTWASRTGHVVSS